MVKGIICTAMLFASLNSSAQIKLPKISIPKINIPKVQLIKKDTVRKPTPVMGVYRTDSIYNGKYRYIMLDDMGNAIMSKELFDTKGPNVIKGTYEYSEGLNAIQFKWQKNLNENVWHNIYYKDRDIWFFLPGNTKFNKF